MSTQIPPQIQNAFDNLRDEVGRLRKHEDNKLLAPIYIQYYLQEGEFRYSNYVSQITDGAGDGGIDAVFVLNEDQDNDLLLIQAKHTPNISAGEVLDAAHKIKDTIESWRKGQHERLSTKTKRILTTAMDSFDDTDPNIEIVIVTTASLSAGKKSKILKALHHCSDLEDYALQVVFGDDLAEKIDSVKSPEYEVKEENIAIDKTSQLFYSPDGEERRCAIVSISARSLKDLYNKHHEHGLFGQNLREYIRHKTVDTALVRSIQKSPRSFWILNNGITIGCADYTLDGDKIKLYRFSIINGAQTTTKIGKTDFQDDFYLPCKIIKEELSDNLDKYAEAANAQKPIKDSDLRANSEEQRVLKQTFENCNPPVYIEIKRGAKKLTVSERRNRGISDWQQINNREYGKLVLAFHFQEPWVSYAYPGKIFSSEETYKKIFHRTCDPKTDIDILRIHDIYLLWKEEKLEEWGEQERQEERVSKEEIVKFGKFSFIANLRLIICYSDIQKARKERKWEEAIVSPVLAGELLLGESDPKDLSEECIRKLKNFFNELITVHSELIESTNKSPQQIYKDRGFYIKLSETIVDKLSRETALQYAYKNFGDVFSQ